MDSPRAFIRLVLLPCFVIGAGCASPASQPCTSCDAGNSGQPELPDDSASAVLSPETTPVLDVEPEAAVVDQSLSVDEEGAIDQAQTAKIDALQPHPTDAPLGEAASPSPVPDGGVLFFSDFEDGTPDGWRSADWNDAGAPDSDWSVLLGDAGSVYSEGVLDTTEWHLSFADVPAIADQIVEARIRVTEFFDTAPSYVAALFARYDPIADSGYFIALRGDGSVIIRKRLQGKSASWAAGIAGGVVPGTWYTVRLEALGNTLSAFLDGALVYSVTDTDPLAAGTAALGTYGATIEVDHVLIAQP